MPSFKESVLVASYEIRDTDTHDPGTDPTYFIVVDAHAFSYIVIKAINTTDQIVRCQIMGNLGKEDFDITEAALLYPCTVGPAFDAQVEDAEIRTMGVADLSLTPLVYISAAALGIPTVGNLRVEVHCFGNNSGM